MLTSPLAPYLLWAKSRHPAPIDLAGSNLLHCDFDDLPGAREALELWIPNDNGYPPLVDAIATHYGVSANQVATAAGCSGANFVAIAALVGPGDDVLVEQPTYDPLIGACRLMGASVRRFARRFESGFAIDLDDLRAAVTDRTKLIILTSPHNPSGIPADRQTLLSIGEIANRVGAHVLVDQVYLDAANTIRQPHDRWIAAAELDGPFLTTSSLTKSYGLAGLRCGWTVAPVAVAERLRRTRDVVDNAGSAPAERLGALALSHKHHLIARAKALLSANVDRMRRFLADHSTLEVASTPAASVTFPRIKGVADAGPFVARLLEHHGVAVAPGAFFDAPAHFRISLAGKTENLERGLVKLSDALRSHVSGS
jgi:aspartate/methionine/tyrosine aminotransferase